MLRPILSNSLVILRECSQPMRYPTFFRRCLHKLSATQHGIQQGLFLLPLLRDEAFYSKYATNLINRDLHRRSTSSRRFSTNMETIHETASIPDNQSLDPAFGTEFEMVVVKTRADRVAGLALGYTRRKMEYAMLAGLVFINGKMQCVKSSTIKEGDVIDIIRQYMSTEETIVFDRLKFLRYSGVTKNGKYRLQVKRYKALSCPSSEFWSRTQT